MTARHLPEDEPFFAQWERRGKMSRTLHSSVALASALSLSPPPSMAVVGSKGKGTAVAAASMALTAAGLTTVAITSPAFRSNRERIRVDGAELSHDEYVRLSAHLSELLPLLPPDHYLSPSGAYTIMGAWWAEQIGSDVLIVEEGMGGVTDEVSLFAHSALAITPIFIEHAGIIGDDLTSIAENLIGAGSSSVRIVGSAEQELHAHHLVHSTAETWGAEIVPVTPLPHINPLIGENMGVGAAVGTAMAGLLGHRPRDFRVPNLPGRSSIHTGPAGRWFVDAAISPAGVAAALEASPLPAPTIVASWPESKDRDGCSALVPNAIHVCVPGLPYPAGLPTLQDVSAGLEGDVLALGTMSFIAEVLDHLKVPTDLW
ncbi:hypothetical protein [Flaviflexus huanghaiensis]|uniref:hypothetical protein n=1 Tax=Flaviflexus huanghaiensis TaxID=1111473 RepID=UPI0015FC2FFB|nr:hypothetical protein [Flaviflexus huanghaiensis]